MGRLTLLLGGQKSGKSRLAARHAEASGRPVVVVAPAVARDLEFAARVARHRADRPAHWRTWETFDLASALAGAGPDAFVLIDALDTWLAELMRAAGVPIGDEVPAPALRDQAETQLLTALRRFAAAVAASSGEALVIAGQPGLGVHAGGPGARTYVDLHGLAVQALSAAADEVLLVVGGRALPLPAPPVAPPEPPQPVAPPEPPQPVRPPELAEPELAEPELPRPAPAADPCGASAAPAQLDRLAASVTATDPAAAATARERHGQLAKPPGSLGQLEEVGIQLAAISGRCPPPVPGFPAAVVVAADHGVHAQGVSDWPQAVTAAMMSTVASGAASVNAIARTVGASVAVLDAGTATRGALPAGVRDGRVRAGTRDLTVEAAMTAPECRAAIAAGAGAARDLLACGADLLATGDLGIANTTASACLIAAFTGAAPAAVTGQGANLDQARIPRKREVVEQALARHGGSRDPLATLASLGGLEHAALVGVMLAGAAGRVPVIIDGVIAGAAALAAVALCPDAAGYLVAGHASAEPGAAAILGHLGQPPLLDLGMRLGEGTGALLAVPLVQAAARVLAETASLDDVMVTAGQ